MAPRVVAAAVIEDAGRVLVAQRSEDKHYPLQWEFPGGKIEPGEEPPVALRREIREELGVEVEVGKLIQHVHFDYGAGHDYDLLFYACKILHGEAEAQPGQGLKQVRWVERRRLVELDFLEGNRFLVRRLARS